MERLVESQRAMTSRLLADAKQKMASSDNKEQEEGALLLLRAFKGMPKNKPLIKFLSEPGIKASMLKTENFYMQENNKNMHVVRSPVFVIDEKPIQWNSPTKGIDLITGDSEDPSFCFTGYWIVAVLEKQSF